MFVPHFAVPFRIGRNGSAATVDQDSDEELLQTVGVLLETRPGERQVVPNYGVDDLTFSTADGITEEWVDDAVRRFEPRADGSVVSAAVDSSGRASVEVEVSR